LRRKVHYKCHAEYQKSATAIPDRLPQEQHVRLSPVSYHHLMPRAFQPVPGPADEVRLAALAAAYPEFRLSKRTRPGDHRPRWELVRNNAAELGLYALITTDLAELTAALEAATGRTADPTNGGR
jgi:hypothetical protein